MIQGNVHNRDFSRLLTGQGRFSCFTYSDYVNVEEVFKGGSFLESFFL
jgi:hypothetical protein